MHEIKQLLLFDLIVAIVLTALRLPVEHSESSRKRERPDAMLPMLAEHDQSVGLELGRHQSDALPGVGLGTKMPGEGPLAALLHPAEKPALFGHFQSVTPSAALTFAISTSTDASIRTPNSSARRAS